MATPATTPVTTPKKSGMPTANDPDCYIPVWVPKKERATGSNSWDATELILVAIVVFFMICVDIGNIKDSSEKVSSFPESTPGVTMREEADWTVKEIPSQKFQKLWEIKAGQNWHSMESLMPEDWLERTRNGNAAMEWFGKFELKDSSGNITRHDSTSAPSSNIAQLLASEVRAIDERSFIQLQLTKTN